jgi:hypothetical protein
MSVGSNTTNGSVLKNGEFLVSNARWPSVFGQQRDERLPLEKRAVFGQQRQMAVSRQQRDERLPLEKRRVFGQQHQMAVSLWSTTPNGFRLS